MPFFGAHLSVSKGYRAMGESALSIGADTFAFFSRGPRGGRLKKLDRADMAGLVAILEENRFGPVVAHAPYTYNLAAAKPDLALWAREAMAEDIERLDLIPGCLYNFHPGSHVGQGAERGVELVAEGLNCVLRPDQRTVVLLETMAGKGTEVGRSFEELAAIIDRVELDSLVGVCLDTCHVSDGGYAVGERLDEVLDEFDAVVGLDRLRALHVNDSKNACGAHKDRHERIGLGHLGLEAFQALVTNPRLAGLPMVLETPQELEGYGFEIGLLRRLAAGEALESVQASLDERAAQDEKGAEAAAGDGTEA